MRRMSRMLPMLNDARSRWPVVALGEVARARLGKTPRKRDYTDRGRVRIVRFRDLGSGVIDWSRRERGFVGEDGLKGLRELCPGDTLITAAAHAADRIGKKLAFVDRLPDGFDRVCYVGELLAIGSRDPAVLDPRWPFYFFQSERGQEEIARAVDGGHLTQATAATMRIALPPLAEQERMAEILASVDRSATATRAVIAGLDEVRQGLFGALIPRDCRVLALGACIEGMDAGWSPRCEPGPAGPGQWGVLKASSVSSGVFVPGANKRLPASLSPRPDIAVRPGDVLVTRASGARDRVGVAALVPATPDRLMLSDKIVRIRPVPWLDAHFLTLLFMTGPVRAQIEARMTGSHMHNISQRSLAGVRIPVPGLDEQRAIGRVFASLDRRRDLETETEEQLHAIKRGLLARFLQGHDLRLPCRATEHVRPTSEYTR
jgi:type I restriction enzyme, S subunit